MALRFQPQFGQVLICDFPREFAPPEMIKRCPVVCVSPKVRNRFGIATVILIVLPPGTMCEILTGVLAGMGVTGSVRYENNISVFDFQSVL